jgi:hypothetical protein
LGKYLRGWNVSGTDYYSSLNLLIRQFTNSIADFIAAGKSESEENDSLSLLAEEEYCGHYLPNVC